jgi:hypothetical protein
VVFDYKQRSASPDRGGERGEESDARLQQQVHELNRDLVEEARFRRDGQQVNVQSTRPWNCSTTD